MTRVFWQAQEKPRATNIEPLGSGKAAGITPDNAHETRKARAAYLLQYIIDRGNEIDQLNASGQNPRNYWRAIIEAQNELLNIYKVELRDACSVEDTHAISILKSNVDKLTRAGFRVGGHQAVPLILDRSGHALVIHMSDLSSYGFMLSSI